jgi:hypothetical protein
LVVSTSEYTVGISVDLGRQVTFDSGSIYEPAPSLDLNFAPSRFSQQGGYYPVQQGQQGNHPMHVSGVPIYNYRGVKGTSTFWRMKLEIPLQPFEQTVTYRLNQGHGIEFLVPAIGMNMRWAAHSCNGFSGGVDMDAFKGPGFESGYDPLWADLLKEHDLYGLHALVGGGDQVSHCIMRMDWSNRSADTFTADLL